MRVTNGGASEGDIDYIAPDHLGSPILTVNRATGAGTREVYTPFGITMHDPEKLAALEAVSLSDDFHFGEMKIDAKGPAGLAGFTGPLPWPSSFITGSPNRLFVCDNQLRSIKDSATGLNYMQARYYDPVIGRFLSIDPVTFMDTGNPGMFNRYAYTFNNPLNMVDPDGMKPDIFENRKRHERAVKQLSEKLEKAG